MKEVKVKEIQNAFWEFLPLYHQKFGHVFRESEGFGVRCTKNQKRAIFLIKKRRGLTPTELGHFLDMRKGSLTTLLDSLEDMKLVERRPDTNDRRRLQIFLTEEGEAYLNRLMARHTEVFLELFSALPDADLDKCLGGMKDVVTVMNKLVTGGKHGID